MAEELTQPEKKILDLGSVIRNETVLAKLPFHNLSKKETLEILIAEQKPAKGTELEEALAKTTASLRVAKRLDSYEVYWKVSPNMEYGEPRQLAYDLDKLVVDKRLDEIGRPVPRRMKLGSLRSIARELGKESTSTEDIKRALLQNSSAYVTLKISYIGLDKTRKWAIDHNTRYGVSFRGSSSPDGTKTEAVFITWNDPFLEILNSTKTRPLDYAYLKALPPTARRWYELISFLFYAIAKNHQPYAEMRYSEYCKLAPQKRLTDRHKAQTQMGKIHRYHLAAGYLAKAEYCSTTDADGNRDWIIRYYPGPAAVEEYDTFNPSGLKAPQSAAPFRVLPNPQEEESRASQARIRPNLPHLEPVPEAAPTTTGKVEDLMRYWRQLKGYPVEGPVPPNDRARCVSLLSQSNGDLAVAEAAIRLALDENPEAINIGFALQNSYPQRALAARVAEEERAAHAEQTKLAEEAFEREKGEVVRRAKDDFAALPTEQRAELENQTRKKLEPFIRRAPDQWTAERIQAASVHGYVTDALDRWARARFRAKQQGPGASTEAPQ